jgi:hypothetical protein
MQKRSSPVTFVRVRPVLLAAVLLFVCAFSAAPLQPTTTTFSFVGTCTDCSGQGNATLVLQNYTLGSTILLANFVSLTYSSNLVNFTLGPANVPSISGSLPANLPSAASVNFFANTGGAAQGMELWTSSSGNWCGGFECAGDYGTAGTWSLYSSAPVPTATGAPALSGRMQICLAALMAAMGALLLKSARRTRTSA